MTSLPALLAAALADRYRLQRELGQGGMATVYLAQDLRHDRQVAVKVLKPELAAVIGAERFLEEIRVTAHLQHPHILPLFDSGNADRFLYYVMPYVEGESLRDRLTREKQLSVKDAIEIAEAVASALDYAHRHKVIHRDIKPENVLLHDGQALIADFGIALAVSQAGVTRLTATGLSVGTPQYMSPEQAMGDRGLDARSDVYSLGATVYEMLVGEPPHLGNSVQAIVAKILSDDPPPIGRTRQLVPGNVDAAVRTALAKSPADRFSSAGAFAAALTDPAFTLRTAGAANASDGRWKRISAVLTLVLTAMVVLALWGWLRPAAEPAGPVTRYIIALPQGQGLVPGLAPRVALSPDGTRFVYVGPGERGGQLWLRERNELRATPLPGTDGAAQPTFSPDGRQVAFVTFSPAPTLEVATLGGGPPVAVAQVTGSSIESGGVAWGTDGYLYATTASGLARVHASGGPLEPVTVRDTVRGETNHLYPEVLPGGRGLLFTIRHASGGGEVAVADLKTGVRRALVRATFARYAASGHLVYVTEEGVLLAAPFDPGRRELTGPATPLMDGVRAAGAADLAVSGEGTLLYVTGTGLSEVVRVKRDGTARVIDSSWAASDVLAPALSPDGSRLAVDINEGGRRDVWIKPLDRGPLSRLTFGEGDNMRPAWTPDGRAVTFVSDRAGQQDLWVQRADGSGAADRVLHIQRNISEGFVSRDGAWIVYRTNLQDPGRADILALRRGLDSVPMQLVATEFEEVMPALSPDGRWLAYASNQSGRSEVYVRPFPNADEARWQVSTGGGTEPVWAHGGGELFYRDGDGWMVAVQVQTAPAFAVLKQRPLFGPIRHVPQGTHAQYTPTLDDKAFLMIRPLIGASGGELIVVENWFEELKGKVRR